MKKFAEFLQQLDVSCDVQNEYEDLREDMCVSAAVSTLKRDYAACLADCDDAPIFWLGLAKTMADKQELTEAVCRKAETYLDDAVSMERYAPVAEFSSEEIQLIKSELRKGIGKAKRRKASKAYKTDWKTGDVFALQMKTEKSQSLNLHGRYLIFQMVDINYYEEDEIPIVYVFITPDKQLPDSREKLLNCIRIPCFIDPLYYRFRLGDRRSIKKQEFSELIYLGNYELFSSPDEQLASRPIFYTGLEWGYVEEGLVVTKIEFLDIKV